MQVNINLQGLHKAINKPFIPYLTNKNRYLVLWGGAGSGKSYFAAQKVLLRIVLGWNKNINHRILCIRKTLPSYRKSVHTLLKELINNWGMNDIAIENKSDLSYSFIPGSEIISASLDDVEKLKSIHGITSIWIEEASELTLEDFIQIDLRLRGETQSYKQIMLSFNPISRLHWLHDRFFTKEDSLVTTFKSTYKDNKFRGEEYDRILESLKEQDENFYRIYALGEWGELGDIIYKNWIIEKEWPEFKTDSIYGVDFGFNSESAVVKVCEKDQEYWIEEKLYQTKLTNSDLIEKLKDIVPKERWEIDPIYVDTAEPNRLEEIRRAGFYCLPSDKSVKDGIDFCKRHKLHLHQESVSLHKEIANYSYKKDKDNHVVDEPVKFRDHCMDALRYAIYTHFGKTEDKLEIVF